MNINLGNFQAQKENLNEGFVAVPSGTYDLRIKKVEEKPTKAKTGSYLQIDYEIINGEHTGKTVTDRLNISNPNEIAVQIAAGTLTAISVCSDTLSWTHPDQLIGKVLKGIVAKERMPNQEDNVPEDQVKYSNSINDYRHIDGRTPADVFDGKPAPNPAGVDAWGNSSQQPPQPVPRQHLPQHMQQQPMQQPVQAPPQQAMMPDPNAQQQFQQPQQMQQQQMQQPPQTQQTTVPDGQAGTPDWGAGAQQHPQSNAAAPDWTTRT